MKPTNEQISYRIFSWLLTVSLLTPIVYIGLFYVPGVTSKTFFFFWIVELLLPFYLYLCIKYFGFSHVKNPIVYASAAFLAVSLISGIFGVNFVRSFWGDFEREQGIYFALHLFAWLMYLILWFQIEAKKLNWVINIFIGEAVYVSFIGVFQRFGMFQLGADEFTYRSTSLFGNPIFFAGFLIIPFFLCIYQFSHHKKPRSFWYLGAVLLIFIGILVTVTAGSILGVVVGSFVSTLIYFINRSNVKKTLLGITALAIVGVLLIIAVPTIRNKFTGADAKSRLIEWKVALHGAVERPVFGVGPENFAFINNKYFDTEVYVSSPGIFDKPHNYSLEVLDTRGFLGLIVYASMFAAVVLGFWKLYKIRSLTKLEFASLTGGLVAYFIHNLFAFDMITQALMLIFLFAISATAWYKPFEKSPNNKLVLNTSVLAALIIFIFAGRANWNLVKANLYLADSVKLGSTNPKLAAIGFEKLESLPLYASASAVGLQYGDYINKLVDQYRVGKKDVDINFLRNQIDSAIANNEKIAYLSPIYAENNISLINLYFLKAQADVQFDPKIYMAIDNMKKIAPNRLEADFGLIDAYNLEGKRDKIPAVLEELKAKAPGNPDVAWEQVYVEAIFGRDRPVLDDAKNLLATYSFSPKVIQQLAKLERFYTDLGKYQIVEALYDEAAQAYPDKGIFYVHLARAYSAAGDKQTAVHVVEKLQQVDAKTYQQYKTEIDNFLK